MQKVILFIAIAIFSACDCEIEGSGWFHDKETNQPVSGASLASGYDDTTQTDSSGYFTIRQLSGGFFGCPDLKLEISKEGFLKQEVTNPVNDTIYLTK